MLIYHHVCWEAISLDVTSITFIYSKSGAIASIYNRFAMLFYNISLPVKFFKYNLFPQTSCGAVGWRSSDHNNIINYGWNKENCNELKNKQALARIKHCISGRSSTAVTIIPPLRYGLMKTVAGLVPAMLSAMVLIAFLTVLRLVCNNPGTMPWAVWFLYCWQQGWLGSSKIQPAEKGTKRHPHIANGLAKQWSCTTFEPRRLVLSSQPGHVTGKIGCLSFRKTSILMNFNQWLSVYSKEVIVRWLNSSVVLNF